MKTKKILDTAMLLGKPTQPLEKLQDLIKIKKWGKTIAGKDWPKEWITVYLKEYPRLDKIILPTPVLPKAQLQDILLTRQSRREFSKNSITLDSLSNLIYSAAGIKDKKHVNRFYPSPGGRYTLEIYILSLNTDLPIGIYHYNPRLHCLENLFTTSKKEMLLCFNQKWIENAGMVILFTGIFWRSTIKYGQRGYRLTLQETGHLGQNFYLVSEAFGLNCCGIGAWLDPKLEELLDIDGVSESVVYALAIGNKR